MKELGAERVDTSPRQDENFGTNGFKNLVSFPRYGRLNEKCRYKTFSNSKCFLLFIALLERYLMQQL